MPRLSRWLKNVEAVCRIQLPDEGRLLGLPDAQVLLNPRHPDHESLMLKVAPLLPTGVREDFLQLRGLSPLLLVRETESITNELRYRQLHSEDSRGGT